MFLLTHLNLFFLMVLYTKVISFDNSFLPFPSHSFQTLYPCLILLLIFNCSLHYKQRKRTHFPSIIKRRVGLETSQMTSLAAFKKYLCIYIFDSGSDTGRDNTSNYNIQWCNISINTSLDIFYDAT